MDRTGTGTVVEQGVFQRIRMSTRFRVGLAVGLLLVGGGAVALSVASSLDPLRAIKATPMAATRAHTVHIQSCQKLNQADTLYMLDNDVTATGTCFPIAADNITLDLNGKTVNYATSDYGAFGLSGNTPDYAAYKSAITTIPCGFLGADTTGGASKPYCLGSGETANNFILTSSAADRGKIIEGGGDETDIGSSTFQPNAPGGVFSIPWNLSYEWNDTTMCANDPSTSCGHWWDKSYDYLRMADGTVIDSQSTPLPVTVRVVITDKDNVTHNTAPAHYTLQRNASPAAPGTQVSTNQPAGSDPVIVFPNPDSTVYWETRVAVAVPSSILGAKRMDVYMDYTDTDGSAKTITLARAVLGTYSLTTTPNMLPTGAMHVYVRGTFDDQTRFSGTFASPGTPVTIAASGATVGTEDINVTRGTQTALLKPYANAVIQNNAATTFTATVALPDAWMNDAPAGQVMTFKGGNPIVDANVHFYAAHGSCDWNAQGMTVGYQRSYCTAVNIFDDTRFAGNSVVENTEITVNGDSTLAINLSSARNALINNNVIHNNVKSIRSRHSIEGVSIVDYWAPGWGDPTTTDTMTDNTIYGGPQGGIKIIRPDTIVENNKVLNMDATYTNGFCYYGHQVNGTYRNNTCQAVNGEGLHIEGNNNLVEGNQVDVELTPNNEEYRWKSEPVFSGDTKSYKDGVKTCHIGEVCSCQQDGTYGIQVEGAGGADIFNNTVTATADKCDSTAFRMPTDKNDNNIHNNTFIAVRKTPTSTASAYGSSFFLISPATGNKINNNSFAADSAVFYERAEFNANMDFQNNTFSYGTVDLQGNSTSNPITKARPTGWDRDWFKVWSLWRMYVYNPSNHNRFLDSTFKNGAIPLGDIGYGFDAPNYETEFYVSYTTPITVKNSGTPVSGATVTVKDNTNTSLIDQYGATVAVPNTDANGQTIPILNQLWYHNLPGKANNEKDYSPYTITAVGAGKTGTCSNVTIDKRKSIVIELSNNTCTITDISDTTPPTAPTSLHTIGTPTSTTTDLQWTVSTDEIGGSGLGGYYIYRCSGAGCIPTTNIGSSQTNMFSDTSLAPGTVYGYLVKAHDNAGNISDPSNTISLTTANCLSSWSCGAWSSCSASGTQTRNCSDANSCPGAVNPYPTSQSCTPTCTPSWSCGAWSICSNSQQTRTCTDANTCAGAVNPYPTTQSCAMPPPACTSVWECSWSACTGGKTTKTCTDVNKCATPTNKPSDESKVCTTATPCTSQWSCGAWSSCTDGQQVRSCVDTGACPGAVNPLPIQQSCSGTGGPGPLKTPNHIIAGSGSGDKPLVRIYSPSGKLEKEFSAYSSTMKKGIHVAAGDVFGTGTDSIITAPGRGATPEIRIFTSTGTLKKSFLAYPKSFKGGVNITAGDINGDGTAEIIVAPETNGASPVIRVFTATGKMIREFYGFEKSFRGGISLTAGDVLGYGAEQIIIAPATVSKTRVRIIDAHTSKPTLRKEFTAYPSTLKAGLSLAVGDAEGNGTLDIITAPAAGNQSPQVRLYSSSGKLLKSFLASSSSFKGGVMLAAGDLLKADQITEILTTTYSGGFPRIFLFERQASGSYTRTQDITAFPGRKIKSASVAVGGW